MTTSDSRTTASRPRRWATGGKVLLLVAAGCLLGLVAHRIAPRRDDGPASRPDDRSGGGDRGAATPIAGKPPTAAASPPRFVAERGGRALQTDPRSPDYDPVALVMAGVALDEVFRAEPRAPGWATTVEQTYSRRLTADLAVMLPEAQLKSLECRTAVCQAEIEVPAEQRQPLLGALSLFAHGDLHGTGRSTTSNGRVVMRHLAAFGEHRDPKVHEAWYRDSRRQHLTRAKPGQGRLEGIAALPAE
jgi:hypothetical protein